MRIDLLVFGVLLILIGLFFTFVTLGFGIICAWPLFIIGGLVFVLGLGLPNRKASGKPIVKSCPGCGADVPADATLCPTCGHLPS